MTHGVYTVYDSAAEAYLMPFFARGRGEAIRSFSSAANDESHQFGKYAKDFTLFEIGTYDDASGSIECHAPVSLGNALEYRSGAVASEVHRAS